MWAAAFAADTAAFRTGAVVEAVAPAATLFVFGAALGAPWHRGLSTALFLLALLGYWLAQRALASASTPTWLARDDRGGRNALARGGTRAWPSPVSSAPSCSGPSCRGRAPGPSSRGAPPTANSGDRVTISPLVDIRTRIVNQADVEVFTVTSPQRSYWRLTSLESFDGRIWSSEGSYQPADGSLGQRRARRPGGDDDRHPGVPDQGAGLHLAAGRLPGRLGRRASTPATTPTPTAC